MRQTCDKVSNIIDKDRRLTVREISKNAKLSVLLGLVIRCARWVPKLLSAAQKKMRKTASLENLYLNSLHHYEPETKRMSQVWLPKGSQAPIKAIRHLSNKKVVCSILG
jgi:hypothetical protein